MIMTSKKISRIRFGDIFAMYNNLICYVKEEILEFMGVISKEVF